MTSDIKTINQRGIRELVADCLQHPEKHVGRPIIIWQSQYNDGIQYWLVSETCRNFNHGKPKDEWKGGKTIWLTDGDQIDKTSDVNHENAHVGFYVLIPSHFEFGGVFNSSSIKQNIELLATENFRAPSMSPDVPVFLFVACKNFRIETSDSSVTPEQYNFEPDFEDWARNVHVSDIFLLDFIRGNGDKEGITYRWYNYFNNQDMSDRKGCDFPDCWLEALRKLRPGYKKVDKLNTIEEDVWNRSFKGISSDLVAEFRKFVIERNI